MILPSPIIMSNPFKERKPIVYMTQGKVELAEVLQSLTAVRPGFSLSQTWDSSRLFLPVLLVYANNKSQGSALAQH